MGGSVTCSIRSRKLNPHISPTICCGRRSAAICGVCSRRVTRRLRRRCRLGKQDGRSPPIGGYDQGLFSCGVAPRTVKYESAACEARPGPPVPSADGSRESRSRREEEVDARASSTTSNTEIGHDPHRPEGLRRRSAACDPALEASDRTPASAGNGHLSLPSPGCWRHGPVFFVAAPRRWRDIAVVAPPRIRTHGARNGRCWGTQPGLWVANTTSHNSLPASLRELVEYAGLVSKTLNETRSQLKRHDANGGSVYPQAAQTLENKA
jgi:hypothetical protein